MTRPSLDSPPDQPSSIASARTAPRPPPPLQRCTPPPWRPSAAALPALCPPIARLTSATPAATAHRGRQGRTASARAKAWQLATTCSAPSSRRRRQQPRIARSRTRRHRTAQHAAATVRETAITRSTLCLLPGRSRPSPRRRHRRRLRRHRCRHRHHQV